MEILSLIISSLIALLAIIVPTMYSLAIDKKERRRLLIDLYREYTSIEYYGIIRTPFYNISLRWLADTPIEDGRYLYRETIVDGWVGSEYIDTKYFRNNIWKDFSNDIDAAYKYHHITPVEYTGLTEHQILTVELNFWTTLSTLYENRLIDRKLLSIFYYEYSYDFKFISEFRKAVVSKAKFEEIPYWVKATENLEKVLGFGTDE